MDFVVSSLVRVCIILLLMTLSVESDERYSEHV